MFVNFSRLDKFLKEFKIEDLFFILAVKQQDQENIEEYYNLNSNQRLLESSYLKQIKNGELRLDKKGTEFLRDLGKSDKISDDTEKLCSWLVELYKDREDGIVKNKQEIRRRAQWYSDETGIFQNRLAVLLQCFMQDCYTKESGLTIQEFKEQNPRMCMNNMLDNLFYKPESMFDKHYTLSKSPLNNYLEDNQQYIEEIWRKNNLE